MQQRVERRKNGQAGVEVLLDHLNAAQRLTLNNIESFGWSLRFVRQPKSSLPVPVVFGPDGKTIGVLEEDGKLNINIEMGVRDS
jgi:hypothetical protein